MCLHISTFGLPEAYHISVDAAAAPVEAVPTSAGRGCSTTAPPAAPSPPTSARSKICDRVSTVRTTRRPRPEISFANFLFDIDITLIDITAGCYHTFVDAAAAPYGAIFGSPDFAAGCYHTSVDAAAAPAEAVPASASTTHTHQHHNKHYIQYTTLPSQNTTTITPCFYDCLRW